MATISILQLQLGFGIADKTKLPGTELSFWKNENKAKNGGQVIWRQLVHD